MNLSQTNFQERTLPMESKSRLIAQDVEKVFPELVRKQIMKAINLLPIKIWLRF